MSIRRHRPVIEPSEFHSFIERPASPNAHIREREAVEKAVAAERSRCAAICREVYEEHRRSGSYPLDMGGLALECAERDCEGGETMSDAKRDMAASFWNACGVSHHDATVLTEAITALIDERIAAALAGLQACGVPTKNLGACTLPMGHHGAHGGRATRLAQDDFAAELDASHGPVEPPASPSSPAPASVLAERQELEAQLAEAKRAAATARADAMDFAAWWTRVGKLLDPDPNESWYDKRHLLAEAAFRAAEAQSRNYVADKVESPGKVTFANGRVVYIEGSFRDACLAVSMVDEARAKAGAAAEKVKP
jgi:hypothetical protein